MSDTTKFHLVEQCDPIIWDAFMAGLRPIYEKYLQEERPKLRQQLRPESIERVN